MGISMRRFVAADGERFAPLPLECTAVPGAVSVLS